MTWAQRRNRESDLPVAPATIVVTRVPSLSGVRWLSRRKLPWRSVIRRPTTIRIWVGRRRVIASVRLFISSSRRRVVLHRSSRGRTVARGPVIVVLATRASVAIAVCRRCFATVAPVRSSSAIVVIECWRRVRPASWRAGSGTISGGHVGLKLKNLKSKQANLARDIGLKSSC